MVIKTKIKHTFTTVLNRSNLTIKSSSIFLNTDLNLTIIIIVRELRIGRRLKLS